MRSPTARLVALPTLAASLVFASTAAAQPATATPAAATTTVAAGPAVGEAAPDFTMPWADASGPRAKPVALKELRGKVVVLAFYPKDRTSGCTAEMTKFRDEYETLFGKNVVVVPVSADSIASHVSWATDMKFPFALASDVDLSVADKYGSHGAGRPVAGRTVFVIGKDGRVAYREMKFNALSEDAYAALASAIKAAQ